MILNLVLNSNNVVSGSNNTRYKYTFNSPLEILDEAEMTIANITMPYSWFNITTINDNKQINVMFPIPSGAFNSYTFIMPNGFYSVVDINAYLQQQMIANGLYLINELGDNVFYIQLLYNPTYYAVQIILQIVPSALPTNWTAPSTWNGFPSTATRSPTISFSRNLFTLLGYPFLTLGTGTGDYSFLSSLVPQGSVVNSLVIRSNIINNDSGFPTDVLDTMPITSAFGTNINYSPPTLKWIKCTAGTFQSFEVSFCDQNLNPMYILDSNVCISILLKNKGNKILPYINAEEGRDKKLVQRLAIELEE
jgi:hypothetical protein